MIIEMKIKKKKKLNLYLRKVKKTRDFFFRQ